MWPIQPSENSQITVYAVAWSTGISVWTSGLGVANVQDYTIFFVLKSASLPCSAPSFYDYMSHNRLDMD